MGNLPTFSQRLLAFYTLAFPSAQAVLGIYVLVSLVTMFFFKAPVLVALISFLPVMMLLAYFLICTVGLYEFAAAYGLKVSPGVVIGMAFAWIPYQLIISYASLRAVGRQMRGVSNWEKTRHVGAHREQVAYRADSLREAGDRAA